MKLRLLLWFFLFSILFFPCNGICFDKDEVVLITAEKVMTLTVHVAKTPEEWQQGLSGRSDLKKSEGMFFLFPRESIITFTTKGISFPIDIILINKIGRVVGMFEDAYGDVNHASPFPIMASLEVKGGFCKEHGVKIGNFISPTAFRLTPQDQARPRQEDRKKVEAKLRANLETHPDDPAVYEELAVFYTVSGQNKKAAEMFQTLLNMEATAKRLNGMGVALANMGQREKAEQYLLRAIEKDPLFYSSYKNLIRVYGHADGLDRVITLLQEAVRGHPEFLETRLGLARLFLASGDLDSAESIIQESGSKIAPPPDFVRMAGDIHLRKGEYEKAADAYVEYLRSRPYDPHASDLRVFIMTHKLRKKREKNE